MLFLCSLLHILRSKTFVIFDVCGLLSLRRVLDLVPYEVPGSSGESRAV